MWKPRAMPLAKLVLASSGATGSGWTLCIANGFRELGREKGEPVVLRPCAEAGADAGQEPGK